MLPRALLAKFIPKPSTFTRFQFNQQRGLHSRNKKAMEFIAKGWIALKEVDRVIDYCELNDTLLEYFFHKAVDQLQPDALYLLGAVYLTGDCVRKDIASMLWCLYRASKKGHAGAAIACGYLLLKEPGRILNLWHIMAHLLHLNTGIAPSIPLTSQLSVAVLLFPYHL
ncbi:hypothetical protein P8452_30777 [Trifolium repens]|nr:hypothetical protein P8452_30777 [Trifolium repens]